MAVAKKDNNSVNVMIGALNSDGVTPINVKVDSSSHGIRVNDDTTGSDNSAANARRDANQVPVLMGVSSVDGITPEMIYVNSDGELLINSN